MGRLREWLRIWWHYLRSIEVTVARSCGHVDHLRLPRKNLRFRVAAYEATPCAECNFREAMVRMQ